MTVTTIVLNIITAIPTAILTAILTTILTVRTFKIKTKTNMRLNYLIESYIAINMACNRELNSEYRKDLETACAKIALFGSKGEIDCLNDVATKIGNGKEHDYDNVLGALRNSLRKELELDPIESKLFFIRYGPKIIK